jgi:hypothetical protein
VVSDVRHRMAKEIAARKDVPAVDSSNVWIATVTA